MSFTFVLFCCSYVEFCSLGSTCVNLWTHVWPVSPGSCIPFDSGGCKSGGQGALLQVPFFCCLVAKSCLTLCDPMYYSTPGFPVRHYLPEFAQTHVHWVSDAIQPSHPLSPLPLPSTSLSGYQSYLAKITSSLCPASLCLNTVPSFMLVLGSWNRIFYCIPSVIYYF